MSYMIAAKAQNHVLHKPLICLFDTGSTSTWIKKSVLPEGVVGKVVSSVQGLTMAGTFKSSLMTTLTDVAFPEFYRSRVLDQVNARIMGTEECRYDIIIGRDVLRHMGLGYDFEVNTMSWGEQTIMMKPNVTNRDDFKAQFAAHLEQWLVADDEEEEDETLEVLHHEEVLYSRPTNDDVFVEDGEGYKSKTISSSSYERADIGEITNNCTHLTPEQRRQLHQLLTKFPTLFDGKLKRFTDETVHLDIDPRVKPTQSRAYTVPQAQRRTFKEELDYLVSIGVLEETGRSEWIAGTFIIPKKNGSVRWISDFRGLNKAIKRKVYHLPRIKDILQRRKGYAYLTKLDLTMCYYTYELDEESKDLCTIATPFGMYRYCRLPMGISASPDIAQEQMDRLMKDIEDIEVYIDDLACFSTDWQSHLQKLEIVLARLEAKGFTINPAKCKWGVQETDFLGHWLTPTGYKPWKKKVDAIAKMERPTTKTELRSFLGLVTYYRDMWPSRSHILAPLTNLSGKKKDFKWTKECEESFQKMKAIAAGDALLVYSDHNLPFTVETDASDYQLGSVIKQNGKPVAYYSKKLNSAQQNYTTIEKELLSIVETFREYRDLLLGARIDVYTDHKNLTYELSTYATQRVMRWRLLLEEFGAKFHYKKGEQNVIADALSRLPIADKEPPLERERTEDTVGDFFTRNSVVRAGTPVDRTCTMNDKSTLAHEEISLVDSIGHDCYLLDVLDDEAMTECLMMYPKFDTEGLHPFHFSTIEKYQQKDPELKKKLKNEPNKYKIELMGQENLIMIRLHKGNEWRIALSDAMLPLLIKWYHNTTAHAMGISRLINTIERHFYHPKLKNETKRIIGACTVCQKNKTGSLQYGTLAPRDATISPWQEVHIDSLGPWTIKIRGVTIKFSALTMIDPVTNLLEVVQYPTNNNGIDATRLFEQTWLARYPKPLICLYDQGTEFMNNDFQFMLLNAGIRGKNISSGNAQSNAIIESVHRTIGQVTRTILLADPPTNNDEVKYAIDRALAIAMHATRCAAHGSLANFSPGALTFRRDMFMDIPFTADVITLSELRQLQIDKRLLEANAKRVRHDYKNGEEILVRTKTTIGNKLKERNEGPYPIEQVHTNGTVTIRRRNNVRERINIRRIRPYGSFRS